MLKSDIFSRPYFFHFHTILTDGHLTLDDYFRHAVQSGVQQLIFLEHIRCQPTYDVLNFAADIKELSDRTGVDAVLGFEVKLLPGGDLDISDAHLDLADVVGIAEHGFPVDPDQLETSLIQMIARYVSLWPSKLAVWVHPGLTFLRKGACLDTDEGYRTLLSLVQGQGVWLERNLRYNLLPEAIAPTLDSTRIVLGADAHTPRDLEIWSQSMFTADKRRL